MTGSLIEQAAFALYIIPGLHVRESHTRPAYLLLSAFALMTEHIGSHDSLTSTISSKKQSENDVEKALDDEKPQPQAEPEKNPKLVRRKLRSQCTTSSD